MPLTTINDPTGGGTLTITCLEQIISLINNTSNIYNKVRKLISKFADSPKDFYHKRYDKPPKENKIMTNNVTA